jgi:hypothetical protein
VSPSGRTVAVYCVGAVAPLPSHSVALISGSTGGVLAVRPLSARGAFSAPTFRTPGVATAALVLPSDEALLLFSIAGSWQWRALPTWSLNNSATIGAAAHDITQGYSADGRYVTIMNGASTIPVWPTSVPYTHRTTAPFTATTPLTAPSAITLSPRGGKLAVADSGTVYVAPVVAANRSHPTAVQLPGNGSISAQTLTFLGDDAHLLSASGDVVAVWDLSQLDRLATEQPSELGYACLGCAGALTAISPNGREIAAVASGGTSAVVQALDRRRAPSVFNSTDDTSFGPPVWDGARLLLPLAGTSRPTGPTSAVRVWTAVPADDQIAAAALSDDGHSVAVVDEHGDGYSEDPDTGRAERRIRGPRDLAQSTIYPLGPGRAAIDSRDRLVAIVDAGRASLYDLSSGAIVSHLPGTDASSVAFAGGLLLLQRSDGRLEIWARRGAVLERTLPGDQSYANYYPVADAGGHLVARQRSDGSTTIADLDSPATLGTLAAPAPRPGRLRIGLAFSPEGRSLITVFQTTDTGAAEIIQHDLGAGNGIRVACAAAGGSLTAADWRRYVCSTPPSDLTCR